mmetsp:Transcript_8875/g.24581  ORF Transcript_8875/g.24581 Transcript_8875/m.24581 type:complete len:109 (+) Transcript_8875:144-470(+)
MSQQGLKCDSGQAGAAVKSFLSHNFHGSWNGNAHPCVRGTHKKRCERSVSTGEGDVPSSTTGNGKMPFAGWLLVVAENWTNPHPSRTYNGQRNLLASTAILGGVTNQM